MLAGIDLLGIGGIRGVIVGIVLIAVAAVAFWLLARFVRGLVEREMSRRLIRPEVVQLVSRAAFVSVVVVALFVVVGAATSNGGVAVTGVLIATILAALGVQDILRNYVSGVYLLSERRLTVGDEIEFGTYVGTIIEIKFRVTYVRAKLGELIIVPNSELFNNTVVVRANRTAGQAPERPPVPGEAAEPSRKPRA
ncbi:MAG: hypothetical protein NVS9B1_12350 [Candidatus Dormibacteraceae bacterium]